MSFLVISDSPTVMADGNGESRHSTAVFEYSEQLLQL